MSMTAKERQDIERITEIIKNATRAAGLITSTGSDGIEVCVTSERRYMVVMTPKTLTAFDEEW